MTRIADIAWDVAFCPADTLAQVFGVPILPEVDLSEDEASDLADELSYYDRETLERIGHARALVSALNSDWTTQARRLRQRWSTCPPLPRGAYRRHLLRAGVLIEHGRECLIGHSAMSAYDCIGAEADPWEETPTEKLSVRAWQAMFDSPVGMLFERRPGRHGYFLHDRVVVEHHADKAASVLARRLHHALQSWDWAELVLSPLPGGSVPTQRTSPLSGRPWCLSVSKVRDDRELGLGVTLAVEMPTSLTQEIQHLDSFHGQPLTDRRLEGLLLHCRLRDPDDVLAAVLRVLEDLQVDRTCIDLARRALRPAESAHTKAYVARGRARVTSRWTLTHCLKCERPLTDATSAARGYGPDCWATLTRHAIVDETADARYYAATSGETWLPEAADRLIDHLLRQARKRREAGVLASARIPGRAR